MLGRRGGDELDIGPGGYSTRPIFTYRESYDDGLGAGNDEADRVTRAATSPFADRLAALLAADWPGLVPHVAMRRRVVPGCGLTGRQCQSSGS